MPSYETLRNKQTELIRKALDGSAFLADIQAAPIEKLTTWVPAVTGPPAVPAHIELAALPTDWDDLGWLTKDGISFARDVSASEVTSFGSVTPTRTDITADTTTITVNCQETKLLTIGLATGADLSNIVPDFRTGEVRIAKPTRAKSRVYRVLSVAVDQGDAGEIYLARFLPRARVSNYAEQTMADNDDPLTWGVTMTGEVDSELGYSEQWLFGGPGWLALLDDMGFPAPATS